MVTVRSSETSFNDGGALTHTIDKPAGTASGDLLVIVAYQHDGTNPVIQWPSGFTQIGVIDNPGGTLIAGAAYKVAGGSEPADYTITNGNGQSGTDQFIGLAALTGVNTVAPISDSDITLIGQTTGDPILPALSVAGVVDGLLLCAWFVLSDASGLGTVTPPAEMTTQGQGQTSVSAGGYALGAWATETLASTGETGERDATTTKNPHGYHAAISIAIAPEEGLSDRLVYDGTEYRNMKINVFDGTDWL